MTAQNWKRQRQPKLTRYFCLEPVPTKRTRQYAASSPSPSSSRTPSTLSPVSTPEVASSTSSSSARSPTEISKPQAKFGSSFFLGEFEHDRDWWTKPIRRPDVFPRDNWCSATWSPPIMSPQELYVIDGLWQWAGKFASVEVAEALEGTRSWDNVGDNGVCLALVDLMLQCRDYLQIERTAAKIRDPDIMKRSYYKYPYEAWLQRCTEEFDRILKLALSTLPPAVGERLVYEEVKHLCLAAVVTSFNVGSDASTYPPTSQYLIPISYLGKYDTTREQLARYGVSVITGGISVGTSEESIMRDVMKHHKKYGKAGISARDAYSPLFGRPLKVPIPPPVGRVPGSKTARYVYLPEKRGDPIPSSRL